jgi:hypothetical protein
MGKHSRLSLKILRIDSETLKQIAALEGETVAVVVRRLIRQYIRDKATPPAPQPQPAPEAQMKIQAWNDVIRLAEKEIELLLRRE